MRLAPTQRVGSPVTRKRVSIAKAVRELSGLWRGTASDLAQAIRTRRISSREAVVSSLARLDRVNPRLNTVVDVL